MSTFFEVSTLLFFYVPQKKKVTNKRYVISKALSHQFLEAVLFAPTVVNVGLKTSASSCQFVASICSKAATGKHHDSVTAL
jgi:hypothetical protein